MADEGIELTSSTPGRPAKPADPVPLGARKSGPSPTSHRCARPQPRTIDSMYSSRLRGSGAGSGGKPDMGGGQTSLVFQILSANAWGPIPVQTDGTGFCTGAVGRFLSDVSRKAAATSDMYDRAFRNAKESRGISESITSAHGGRQARVAKQGRLDQEKCDFEHVAEYLFCDTQMHICQ